MSERIEIATEDTTADIAENVRNIAAAVIRLGSAVNSLANELAYTQQRLLNVEDQATMAKNAARMAERRAIDDYVDAKFFTDQLATSVRASLLAELARLRATPETHDVCATCGRTGAIAALDAWIQKTQSIQATQNSWQFHGRHIKQQLDLLQTQGTGWDMHNHIRNAPFCWLCSEYYTCGSIWCIPPCYHECDHEGPGHVFGANLLRYRDSKSHRASVIAIESQNQERGGRGGGRGGKRPRY